MAAYPQDPPVLADDRPLTLRLHPAVKLTDDQFYELALLNRDLRLERTAQGELIVMPPTGGETGARNAKITTRLTLWAESDGTGVTFDSSTGFRLPNGAIRSPDSAWVRKSRWAALTPEQRKKYIPLCPEFVIELRSDNDSLEGLQAKMQEYLANGAQLGWLLDPLTKQVYVYRSGQIVEVLDHPPVLRGEGVVGGWMLDLGEVW